MKLPALVCLLFALGAAAAIVMHGFQILLGYLLAMSATAAWMLWRADKRAGSSQTTHE